MTLTELESTPLFSQVKYQTATAVILKIKNGSAILWDSTQGWLSYPIPASELILTSTYTAPGGTPSNFASAPLYSKVYINGKQGFLIEKREIPNQFTGETVRTGLVWFYDTETFDWYDQSVIAFAANGTKPPPAEASLGFNTLIKWGAIVGVGYFLLKGDKPKSSTAEAD